MPRLSAQRFTPSIIRSLPPGEHPDALVRGLFCRVTKTGAKSFTCRYRHHKKQRRVTLGPVGTLTLAQAREEARDVLERVRAGEDPAGEAKRLKEEATVSELVTKYIASRKGKASTKANYRTLLRVQISPAIGDRPVSTVSKKDVQAMHARVAKKTEARAGASVKLLRAAFTWGADHGLLPEDHSNPAARVRIASTKSRQRYLSADERRRFQAALESLRRTSRINPQTWDAIELLELTGARKTEITGALWSEVDLEAATITKIDHKSSARGKVRRIILSEDALIILRRLHAERSESIGYVFPSPKNPAKPLDHLEHAFNKILELAGIKNFRIHDLRHDYASRALANGVSLGVLAELLGHASVTVTQRYAHLCDSAARSAVDIINASMRRTPDNVIEMSPKKSKKKTS